MSATSTYMTFLMHGVTATNTTTYSKLVDIKEFPDLGGAPEMLDTTTLSHGARTYIPGIQETEGMTFVTNYDKTAYQALKALEGDEEKYSVWFGGTEVAGSLPTPTGSEGKFDFSGYLSVFVTGSGVNEVRNMTITIAPTTEISFSVAG